MSTGNEDSGQTQINFNDKVKALRIKKSIAFFVLGVLLLSIYPFRWERGPIQTEGGLKIIHLQDRWTGQSWLKIYGQKSREQLWDEALNKTLYLGEKGQDFYSGEEFPYLANNLIQKESNKILNGPLGQQRKESLEKQLKEAKKKEVPYNQGVNQYLKLEEQFFEEFYLENYPPKTWVGADGKVRNLAKAEAYTDWMYGEREKVIAAKMPEDIMLAYNSYNEVANEVKKLNNKIKNLSNWANDEAKKSLSENAFYKRHIATGIWSGLTVASFLIAICLMIRKHNPIKQQITSETS